MFLVCQQCVVSQKTLKLNALKQASVYPSALCMNYKQTAYPLYRDHFALRVVFYSYVHCCLSILKHKAVNVKKCIKYVCLIQYAFNALKGTDEDGCRTLFTRTSFITFPLNLFLHMAISVLGENCANTRLQGHSPSTRLFRHLREINWPFSLSVFIPILTDPRVCYLYLLLFSHITFFHICISVH